ncbi:uncharacterized protein LOC135834239 [Planococcus citri]|uniref:uncharacterized protein LOC135834239 n=1 Tax=Planococcus citri TaxID=170843 RepID=UPI0031F8E1DE
MNYQTKLPFFILLVLKGILSAQLSLPSFKYDISTSLADWISKIFKSRENLNINSAMKNALASAYIIGEWEYNITEKMNLVAPFQSQIILYDTNFYTHPKDTEETKPFTLKSWRSSDNKIRLSSKKFRITVEGEIRAEKNRCHAGYFTTLHFEDFVLDAIPVSDTLYGVEFSTEFSYNKYYVWNHGSEAHIKWTKNDDYRDDHRKKLTKMIIPILPSILREYMNGNPKFSEAFDQITKIYNYLPGTVSARPNFSDHRHQYYYFIPLIHIYGFCLRNVTIQGLLNIEVTDVDTESYFFTDTILMRNVTGNMILDYGSEEMAPLGLNFLIDYLSISIKNGTDFVHVEARSYCVNRTNGDPLTHRQSASIIRRIECALAPALMPSKRAWKTCHMESDIGHIEITNATDWETIVRKYQDWIPFNQVDNVPKKTGLMRRIFQAAGECLRSLP